MRTFLIITILVFAMILGAQESWMPFSFDTGNIYTYFFNIETPYYTMAGTTNGFYMTPEDDPSFIETNLPVKGFAPIDDTHCFFVMGDGSWSDGVYRFNMETLQYDVAIYTPWPNFLYKHPGGGGYFAGAEYGLYMSSDGVTWNEPTWTYPCYDITIYNNHIDIAAGNHILHSPDNGDTWDDFATSQVFTAVEYDPWGTLYGAFGGVSNSSGLWSSMNHGETWSLEFYSDHISCIDWNMNSDLFVGWNPPEDIESEGIGIWHPDIWQIECLNEDLPNLHINSITCHPLIDCINVIACTENGVYMNTSYPFSAEKTPDVEGTLNLSNYPNPFNPQTTIRFSLDESSHCKLSIYNVKGQKVASLVDEQLDRGEHTIVWDGSDRQGKAVSSGIYFCKLVSGNRVDNRKMVLLK